MSITVTFNDGTAVRLYGLAAWDFLRTVQREGWVLQ